MSRELLDAAIRANYAYQCEAMVRADVAGLSTLLEDGYTLTHMTGYVQSKTAWLADIASGEMRYHSVKDVEISTSGDDSAATLIARGGWNCALSLRRTRAVIGPQPAPSHRSGDRATAHPPPSRTSAPMA